MPTPPLLAAPYTPPAVRRGDRTTCLYRDSEVIITTTHDGRIPWPRCRAAEGRGSGSGLLVTEELVRAIRTESAAALMYWFGVGEKAVWRWRQAFLDGPGKFRTPGSVKAHHAASEAGAAAMAAKDWTDAERDARSEQAKQTEAHRRLGPRWTPRNGGWTAAEVKLLRGRLTDAEVAAKTGRTVHAVRAKRQRIERAP